MNKKTPMRKCAGCGASRPKDELIRIAASENGASADPSGKLNGRGVYLCRGNMECFELAKKRKAIGRGIKKELTDEELDALRKELEKYEK